LGATRERDKIETADLIKFIKNGDTVHLNNDWRIVQRRVSNEQRIEVMGPDYLHSDLLTKKGVFTERIGYQTRYFIPAENDTAKILDEVIKIAPVSRVEQSNGRLAAKSTDWSAKSEPANLSAASSVKVKSSHEATSPKERPSLMAALKAGEERSRAEFGGGSTAKSKEVAI
jgi:hypothetical protein